MKRKLLVALLALSCIFCFAFGLAACANTGNGNGSLDYLPPNPPPADGEPQYEGPGMKQPEVLLDYELNEDEKGYTVTGIGSATGSTLKIPSVYNGLPVTAIGEGAFTENTQLQIVILSEYIKTIENDAFSYCSELISLSIPDNVTYIGISAFAGCSGLLNINIGTGVTEIGANAFSNCAIVKMTIPGNVQTIGANAFSSCTSLKQVKIESGVKSIGKRAFLFCTALNNLEMGSGVEFIGESAFEGCTALTKAKIPNGLIKIETSAFKDCTSLARISIPFVGSWNPEVPVPTPDPENPDDEEPIVSFFGHIFGAISSTTQNDSIPSSLKTVEITGGNIIRKGAFNMITAIENIYITEGVTILDESSIIGIWNLKTLVIGTCVKTIRSQAVFGGERPQAIYYMGTSAEWNKIKPPETDSDGSRSNDDLLLPTRYYYSENAPTESGNFWHFVDGEPVIWKNN